MPYRKGVPSWYSGSKGNLYYQDNLEDDRKYDNPVQEFMLKNKNEFFEIEERQPSKGLELPTSLPPKNREQFEPTQREQKEESIPYEYQGKYNNVGDLAKKLDDEANPYTNPFYKIFGAPQKIKDDYANKHYGKEFDKRAKEIWDNELKKDSENLKGFQSKNGLGQFLDVTAEKARREFTAGTHKNILQDQDMGTAGNIASDILGGIAGFLNPEMGIAKTGQFAEGLSNKLMRGSGKAAEWGKTALKGGLETLPQDFIRSNSEGEDLQGAAESALKQGLLGAGFEVGLKGLGKVIGDKLKSNLEIKNNLESNKLEPIQSNNFKNEMVEDINNYVPKENLGNMKDFANINELAPTIDVPVRGDLEVDVENPTFRSLRAERNKLNRKYLDLVNSGHHESADEVYDEILKISENLNEKPMVTSVNGWQDKNMLSLARETADRNFEDVMGADADNFKMSHLEPIKSGEADRIKFLNTMRDEVKSLDIKPFSKESELVQKYGEGVISLEELKNSTNDWEKIVNASDYMRNRYDEFLTKINESLGRNGYSPIQGRENYFPHQDEMDGILQKIGISTDELPTSINGITDQFTPGKSWFGNALHRKGDKTVYDAVRGFDNYIEGASKLMYHTDNIQRLRNMEVEIRNMVGDGKELSNFVSNLHEYTNLLAGKKSSVDRAFEQGLVGRQIYKISNFIKGQVGANMVGANVSSALTNFIPLTQSIATTDKPATIKALGETLYDVIRGDNSFIDKSNFLTRRFGSDKIALTKWEKVGKAATKPFEVIDHFTSRFIVNSKYNELISKGLDEKTAIREADNYAAKLMADRSLGQTPNFLNSKALGAATQFQTEVNNQLSFLFKDLPKMYKDENKIKGVGKLGFAVTQMMALSYGFNQIYEMVVGRKPALDPISMIVDTKEDFGNDELSAEEKRNKFLSRIGDQLPFASVFSGGRIPVMEPINAVKKGLVSLAGIPFGVDNVKNDLLESGKELAPYLLPTGGNQIRKSITGLNAFNEGTVDSKTGAVKYPVEQDLSNHIKGALFGPSGFKEAQNYYGENRSPLSEKQSEYVKNSKDKKGAYEAILHEKEVNEAKNELFNYIGDDGESTSKEKTKISKQLKDLSLDEQLDLINNLKEKYPSGSKDNAAEPQIQSEKNRLLNILGESNKSSEQIRKEFNSIENKLKNKSTEDRIKTLKQLQDYYKRW